MREGVDFATSRAPEASALFGLAEWHYPQEVVSQKGKAPRIPPTMKYLALLWLAALLAACDTSEEDRNFYYNGWMKPETDANKRIYGGAVPGAKQPLPSSE
jgi:hypothetical protein